MKDIDNALLEVILRSLEELKSDIRDIRSDIKSVNLSEHKLVCNNEMCEKFVKKNDLDPLIDKRIDEYFNRKITFFDKVVSFATNVGKTIFGLSLLGTFIYALAKFFGIM
jgi:hypothetical protein